MREYLKYLFQLILSPGHGWEDIDKGSGNPAAVAARGFYPLIAIASLSVWMQGFYHPHIPFLALFMRMIVTFVVYFISYFFGTFMLSVFVEPMLDDRYDEVRCQTFTLYSLGLLAVISIIANCLPVSSALLFFLPMFAALVQWKGHLYMHVRPDKVGLFMILAILGVLAPPYIFYFLFSILF